MTRRKWSVLAVSAAAAASVICAGATALLSRIRLIRLIWFR